MTARYIDMTPTWAAIMPAFFAIFECGTPEGKAIAKEELARLAAAMDSTNAAAKAAPDQEAIDAERNAFGLESAKVGRGHATLDLERAARDFAALGQHIRAACYFAAAARIAPADLPERAGLNVAADLQERAAADLLNQSFEVARKEAIKESQEARALAIDTAFKEGRRTGLIEARDLQEKEAMRNSHAGPNTWQTRAILAEKKARELGEAIEAGIKALSGPHYGQLDAIADYASDARNILESAIKTEGVKK